MDPWQWHIFLWHISQYGDQVAASAAACGCVVALAIHREWRLAIKFVALVVGVLTIEVASKMAYYGWGLQFGIASFHGMSGHALRAFAIWPTFGFVLFGGSSHARQMAAAAVGGAISIAVLASMVAAGFHTPVEVIAGALAGSVVPMLFAKHDRLGPLRESYRWAIIVVVLLVYSRMPRGHFDYEMAIARTASGLSRRDARPLCSKPHGVVTCDHGGVRGE
jgi:hypothetical protein